MTQDEQKQFDLLQQRLVEADRSVEQNRVYFTSALDKSNNEARLYRGLFWTLVLLSIMVIVARIVQK